MKLTKNDIFRYAIFLLISACVDSVHFDSPEVQSQIIIEGMISDLAPPYTVMISKGTSLDAKTPFRPPVTNAKVKLYDDEGHIENLTETAQGVYNTGGLITGKVGHSYYISIETTDGKVYQSDPDPLTPAGDINNIRFDFEARTTVKDFGEVNSDVFNIYVDAQAPQGNSNFVRWRFKGTYQVTTYPEQHNTQVPPYSAYKDPRPCSGYRIIPGPEGSGGLLEKTGECTCCICWPVHYETKPTLSDGELVADNQFKNVKVGEVPITNNTFHDKYMVEVDQMSLSKKAFEFFRAVRLQKESAASIFQPPFGEIKGNISSLNSSDLVTGLFWATSVRSKHIFIRREDVPYPITPIEFIADDCTTAFPNSSNVKPANWE